MLDTTEAFSSFSVNDLNEAKEFYGTTIGLPIKKIAMDNYELMEIPLGNTKVMVYPKKDHTPASFTVLNFPVQDVEKAVEELAKKGIRFEQYNLPGIKTDDKGISRDGGRAMAWFKDPAGNILSVLQEG